MTELLAGLTVGLAAGISPGPLQTLVVTSALERGFGAGWRVAVAPLLVDAPVVAVAALLASSVPSGALNGLGVVGGIVVGGTGLWSLARSGRAVAAEDGGGAGDVWRGMVVNATSPHPWVFWLTAGGPLLVSGWRSAPWRGVAFVAGFYLLLVGSKVALAWVVARSRHLLAQAWRRRLVVAGGVLLVAGGALLVWQGATGRFG